MLDRAGASSGSKMWRGPQTVVCWVETDTNEKTESTGEFSVLVWK